jgi:hypothetical protein
LAPKFSCKDAFFSQIRYGQPIFKFYMAQYASHIYRTPPKTKHSGVVCVRERYRKAQKSDCLESSQKRWLTYHFLLGMDILVKKGSRPHPKFCMARVVLMIYTLMLRELGFGVWRTYFETAVISLFFMTWCGAQRRIRLMYTSLLVSFDRYTFHLAPCGIWRWVIHLGFGKQGYSSQKIYNRNREVSKRLGARPHFSHPAFSNSHVRWRSCISELSRWLEHVK